MVFLDPIRSTPSGLYWRRALAGPIRLTACLQQALSFIVMQDAGRANDNDE